MPLAIPIVDGLVGLGTSLIERIFPDPIKANEAKLELLKMQQTGELAQLQANTQLALKQGDINFEEAKSENLFVSGWRPFVGWTCGLGFFAKFLGGPLIFVLAQLVDKTIVLPPIDVAEMLPLLAGMLGLGALRTYEKVNK